MLSGEALSSACFFGGGELTVARLAVKRYSRLTVPVAVHFYGMHFEMVGSMLIFATLLLFSKTLLYLVQFPIIISITSFAICYARRGGELTLLA